MKKLIMTLALLQITYASAATTFTLASGSTLGTDTTLIFNVEDTVNGGIGTVTINTTNASIFNSTFTFVPNSTELRLQTLDDQSADITISYTGSDIIVGSATTSMRSWGGGSATQFINQEVNVLAVPSGTNPATYRGDGTKPGGEAVAVGILDRDFGSINLKNLSGALGDFTVSGLQDFEKVGGGSGNGNLIYDFDIIPEPSSAMLFGLASCGLLIRRRR